MPDMLDVATAGAAGWVLTYLAHSTVAIGLVWAACRVDWVRAPDARDLAWKLALLVGVVTATGAHLRQASPVGVVDRMTRVAAEVAPPASGMLTPVWSESLDLGPVTVPFEAGVISMRADVVEPTPACRALLRGGGVENPGWVGRVSQVCGAGREVSWYHALLLIWIVGATLALGGVLRSRRAPRELRLALVRADSRAERICREVLAGTGLRARLTVSPTLDAPCVVDSRTIALPVRCEADLTDDELRAVLAHEVAHVGRRDVAWLRLGRYLTALLWLQPLNRVALRGMIEAAELVCDDWALRRMRQPLGLARSISRVAEWSVVPHRRPAAVVAMVGRDGRSLSGRVRRILAGPPTEAHSRWKRLSGGVALLLPLLMLPAVPGPPTRSVFFSARGSLSAFENQLFSYDVDEGAGAQRSMRVEVRQIGSGTATVEHEVMVIARIDGALTTPGS